MRNSCAESPMIEAVNPHDLSNGDFIQINEVMQDMWASESGIGELAQCNHCGKMISKEAAFHGLPRELQKKTVAKILQALGTETVPCTVCNGDTRFIYGPKNTDKIRNRLLNSLDSFLVLASSQADGIVGFNEAYIDPLERLFELDFKDHYGKIGFREIQKRVGKILGYTPKYFLLASSLGLLPEYRNLGNMYKMMESFALSIPEKYLGTPGMAELGIGGVTHRMSEGIGHGIPLGIEDDPHLSSLMRDIGETYHCNLILYPDAVNMYHEHSTQGMAHWIDLVSRTKRHARRKISEPTSVLTTSEMNDRQPVSAAFSMQTPDFSPEFASLAS